MATMDFELSTGENVFPIETYRKGSHCFTSYNLEILILKIWDSGNSDQTPTSTFN